MEPQPHSSGETSTYTTAASSSGLSGTTGVAMHEMIDTVEVMFQIPPNPCAVLFIAHEGNGTPLTFWEPQLQHQHCTGIPDHVAVVKHALQRSYAVIAVKSVKSFWQEWPPQASQDACNLIALLASWTAQHHLDRLPLVGFGCGSGGNFISMLALSIRFSALVLMVSSGVRQAWERATAGYTPAVLFVHMPKDQVTASRIQQYTQLLASRGVPVAELKAPAFPINPFFFSNHIPGLGSDASSKLYTAMQSEGSLDAFGRVLSPPRVTEIQSLLRRYDVLPLDLGDARYIGLLTEHIHSLVRVAHGRHALTGRKCPEIFTWLEQQLWGAPAAARGLQQQQESQPMNASAAQQRLPFSKFSGSS